MSSVVAHNAKVEVVFDDLLADQHRRYILDSTLSRLFYKPAKYRHQYIEPVMESYSFSLPIRYVTPIHIIQSRIYKALYSSQSARLTQNQTTPQKA